MRTTCDPLHRTGRESAIPTCGQSHRPVAELTVWARNEDEAIEMANHLVAVFVGDPTLDDVQSINGRLPFRFRLDDADFDRPEEIYA